MDRKTTAERRPIRRALLAGLGGAAGTLLLVLAEAALCGAGVLPQGREGAWTRAALIFASLLAGWIAGGGAKTGKLYCAGAAAGVMLFFVIILAVVSGNSTPINISLLWNAAGVLCGVFAGGLLSARGKKHRRRRR